MDIEVRPVTDDEFEEFVGVDQAAFGGGPPDPDGLAQHRKAAELDRTRAVFEGGRMVGASGAFSLELTLPGRTTVPVAAVTWVGVLPTHRRRGHLRRMMAALLDDAAAREEPVALLLASESLIYGRFGYGLATTEHTVEIESRHGAMRPPFKAGGRVELLDAAQAAKVLPALLDAARLLQPGDLRRPDAFWDGLFRDPEKERGGASAQFYAVHESPAGEADGYAVYRVKMDWPYGTPRGKVLAGELVGLTPAAEAALLEFLLSIDLTDEVELGVRPADDPLRWMLVDPRRYRTTMANDFLWARLLDPVVALAARRYSVPGRLVLEVADAFRPEVAGRFLVDGGPDGAECRPTRDDPDVTLSAEELGAIYLGGVAPSTLAAAGRLAEERPGALARADAMFVAHPGPFCRTGF